MRKRWLKQLPNAKIPQSTIGPRVFSFSTMAATRNIYPACIFGCTPNSLHPRTGSEFIYVTTRQKQERIRRGWQNVCVWRTWQGDYVRVLSWSSLNLMFSIWCFTKRSIVNEGKIKFRGQFFQTKLLSVHKYRKRGVFNTIFHVVIVCQTIFKITLSWRYAGPKIPHDRKETMHVDNAKEIYVMN